MTDYYEELHLDRSLGLEELNRKLSHLESDWKQRRTTRPEAALRVLNLIVEARKVFKDGSSRLRYDRELEESKSPKPQGNSDERDAADFEHWRSEAERYLSEGQPDRAKIAVEKALMLSRVARDDAEFCLLAARAYIFSGDANSAMTYINTAIALEPDDPIYESWKARILINMEQNRKSYEESYATRALDSAKLTIRKAERAGDRENEGEAYGLVAAIQYFMLNQKDAAEESAQRAVALGDDLGNGSRVLGEIEEERRKREAAAEWERKRKQEEDRRAQEKRAEEELNARQREEHERALQQKRIDYENRLASLSRLNAIGWVAFVASIAITIFLVLSAYPQDKSTLTLVSGLPLALGIFMLNMGNGANYHSGTPIVISIISFFLPGETSQSNRNAS